MNQSSKKSHCSLLFIAIVILSFTNEIYSHNWLVSPVSRSNQAQTQTGCRVGGEGNPNCPGPCDRSLSQTTRAAINVKRGDTIPVKWNRHQHPGGFVRLAWSPTSNSDSHSSFDTYVDKIVCKEIGGCGPTKSSDPSGQSNGIDCGLTYTIPSWLSDGKWTLQWAYFGGFYNAGDYYACADYVVSGGTSLVSQNPAVFQGGDYTYPNQNVCLFYSTNKLHVCKVEPCTTGSFPAGAQKGAAAGISSNPPQPPPPSSPPPQQPASTTSKPVTTSPKLVTTGTSSSSSTTSTPAPSNSLCYKPNTPNLGGKIKKSPPICGANGNGRYRCAEGLCCSKYGYCGPIKESDGNYYDFSNGVSTKLSTDQAFYLYCNSSSSIDYRKYSCSSLGLDSKGRQQQIVEESTMSYDDGDDKSNLNSGKILENSFVGVVIGLVSVMVVLFVG